MRYFITAFWCTLSLRLKNWKTWLVLLLLPCLVLGAACLTPEAGTDAPVTVGVVLPERGGQALWTLLSGQNSGILAFVEATEDTIDRNVASGRWDCGIILAEDFDRRLEALDLDRIITLRISDSSTVYPLVQESISACIARLAGPYIAREYLLDSGIACEENIHEFLPRLEGVLDASDRVLVIPTALNGAQLEVPELAERGIQRFLLWLISAVILVRMLFGAADLGKWNSSAAAKRMHPLRSPGIMLAARAAADGILMLLSGCAAMVLLKESGWGCLAVLGYTLFWMSVSVLLAQFPRLHEALPVCLPFAVAISFLLSSALVDISVVLPSLSVISRILPVTLFLRTCAGDTAALGLLLTAALLCGLFSLRAARSAANR